MVALSDKAGLARFRISLSKDSCRGINKAVKKVVNEEINSLTTLFLKRKN
jgi:hypothetical protein